MIWLKHLGFWWSGVSGIWGGLVGSGVCLSDSVSEWMRMPSLAFWLAALWAIPAAYTIAMIRLCKNRTNQSHTSAWLKAIYAARKWFDSSTWTLQCKEGEDLVLLQSVAALTPRDELVVNIVPDRSGQSQRKYSHLAVTKPTVCSKTHNRLGSLIRNTAPSPVPGVRADDGLSPKYWIIPENCQKIYFSKHLEVGAGPAQKLETHLSGD